MAPDSVSLDVAGIKALAHPLRLRLVGLLRVSGPATATELARRLGDTTSGTTSWHLRRLAEAGFVVEVPGETGRERRWAAAHRATTWDAGALLQQPGGRAAVAEWLRALVAAWTSRTLAYVESLDRLDLTWITAAQFHDSVLRLTPHMIEELSRELNDVVDRYREQGKELGPDAIPTWVVLQAIPGADRQPSSGPAS